MDSKKRVLLKLTGEIFFDKNDRTLSLKHIHALIAQMHALKDQIQFGIVIGGGNFFRGNQHGKKLGITPSVGHQIGMLATIMNGLMLKDLLEQQKMPAALFCAVPSPGIGKPISQQAIDEALHGQRTLIFSGGTGNPFFTTDTNAVLRSLQIGADEVWKGTGVDGIYSSDPAKDPNATLLKKVSYTQAIQDKLGVMDLTAYAMAEQHHQKIRIFDIFEPDALIHAAENNNFGSLIA